MFVCFVLLFLAYCVCLIVAFGFVAVSLWLVYWLVVIMSVSTCFGFPCLGIWVYCWVFDWFDLFVVRVV